MAVLSSHPTFGQSATKTIALKQGEVFDILLLSQNPNTGDALNDYFKTAFPVAKRMSYQPMPGFKIKDHTQGNLRPSNLIFGKWANATKREAFLTQITKEVPDFHERRRNIWSYFGLCYFEMQEDLVFEIDPSKFHVATAYWFKVKGESVAFIKKWKKQLQKQQGNVLVELQNGSSPFGYLYHPDYFVVSSFENEAAFRASQEKTRQLNMDNIEHVNEFILE